MLTFNFLLFGPFGDKDEDSEDVVEFQATRPIRTYQERFEALQVMKEACDKECPSTPASSAKVEDGLAESLGQALT